MDNIYNNSSPTSPASDDDAYNTADARIYFGPLRSPEKKFVPNGVRRRAICPPSIVSSLRRSPRLSTPRSGSHSLDTIRGTVDKDETERPDNEAEADMGGGGACASRSGTPENERLPQDEPSSALANKVIRAHDNPSPPPCSPDALVSHGLRLSISPPPSPPALEFPIDPALHGKFSGPSTPPSLLSRGLLPANPLPSNDVEALAQTDLISFDSFPNSGPAVLCSACTSNAPTTILRLHSGNPSVDELLSRSPSPSRPILSNEVSILSFLRPSLSEHSDNSNIKGKGKLGREITPDSVDEQAVVDTLSLADAEEPSGTSPNSHSINPPDWLPPNISRSQLQDTVLTPVRSSSRLRPSGKLHANKVGRYVDEENEASAVVSLPKSLLFPSNAQTQERMEEKPKDSSLRNDVADDESTKIVSVDTDGGVTVLGDSGKKYEGIGKSKELGLELGDRRSGQGAESASARELGSLSPASATLLIQLFPSSRTSPIPAQSSVLNLEDRSTNVEASDSLLREHSFSRTPRIPAPMTPIRSARPIRFRSPVRSHPSQVRLHPAALDDPNRTPARRIHIDQATAQGQMSPKKAVYFTATSGNHGPELLRTPVLSIPSTDSPARRINVSDAPTLTGKWHGMRFGSPVRNTEARRSGLIEPRSPNSAGKEPISQAARQPEATSESPWLPSSSSSDSAMSRLAKLPFPLATSQKDPCKETIGQGSKAGSAPMPSPTPVKSSLKQKSSRIPRGVKPYAKPAMQLSGKDKSSTIMRTVDLQKVGGTDKVTMQKTRCTEIGSGSSDDARPSDAAGSSSTSCGNSTPAPNLKRKRVLDKASPNKPRPVVLLRQVPSVIGPRYASKPPDLHPESTRPKKTPRPFKIRRVVEQHPEVPPRQVIPRETDGQEHVKTPPPEGDNGHKPGNEPDIVTIIATPPSSPSLPERPPPSPSLNDTSFTHPVDSPEQNFRRTTRKRKEVNPTAVADVFGESQTRPLQRRRKWNTQPPARLDGALTGMSAVALKALTSLNTVRNQKYLAAKLETEVIRKDGARPESPTVKVRTIIQRQQEEKGKQRKQRAERRARRSEDGSAGGQSDTEGQSDAEDANEVDVDSGRDSDGLDSSPYRRRHKRGPGDEEDFETPVRSEQGKRPKFGDESDVEVRDDKKRVKWNRGLFTTIYLDEVKLGTRPPPSQDIITKGCLAPTAKALPLDTLGNLPHADSPLTELVEENVVVKKFVYDNDVEPPQQIIVVKNTRLRSKKGKV